MVFRIPYPWYFESPIHGILNPLPMVFRIPYPWYFEPSTHGKNEGFNLQWWGSKSNDKFDPGVEFSGVQKYNMTQTSVK